MSKENQTTYNEARYNPNVVGTHLFYVKGEGEDADKKEYGNLVVFSLMSISGYIDNIRAEEPNIAPENLVTKMVENATVLVSDYENDKAKEL